MLEPDAIRLEIVKAMVPVGSRHGLTSDELVDTCARLEKYVIGSPSVGEMPTPASRKTLTKPVKDNSVPGFLSS
ncbi:hypothetical protein U2181_15380 [Listeria monocytogenes]|uniref:hypothetical protein n=1 Tax=Listeria monocytogenes TaxID=1639 RepID=UPI002FDBFF8B